MALALQWLLIGHAYAAEWQGSVPIKSLEPAGQSRAFLWVPPSCQRVQAVLLAQHNMEEISILEHPKFRAALTELGFTEVWCAPPFDHHFRFNEGAGDIFIGMMDALARESGYDELKFASIPDQKVGVKSLPLTARSDAGAKVRFFVREGPAEVEGDTLKFTPIPPRARLPINVTVIAWQFGQATEPKLRTAEPVERSFLLRP